MIVFLYILAVVLAFMVGTVGFSFVNTVAYRFPRQRSILKEHFCCDFCETIIKPYEAVPVISYAVLRGRCRYCNEPLSKRDFINEIAGGLIGLLIFFRFGDVGDISSSFILSSPLDIVVHFNVLKLITLLILFLFVCVLDLVILVDHDTMEIPNRFVIVMLYIAVAALVFVPGPGLVSHLIGGLCISVPMFLLTLAIPGAFGGGDIKLTAAVGLFLGWKLNIVGFLIGLLFGGIYGMIQLGTGKKGKKEHFSFGPFLCAGYMMAAFCGMDIINAYLRLAELIRG